MKRISHLLAGIAVVTGCGTEPTATTTDMQPPAPSASKGEVSQASIDKDLGTLRHVTAAFHDFKKATQEGWSAQITACMTDPKAGGMGFHYGNTALIDGSVRVDQPELLLYEPTRNGGLRLVAVEYIIPYTEHAREATPPVLFGQKFLQNDVFQLWGLHAWVWKHNPSGIFANWNPEVTCKYGSAAATMSH